MISIKYIEARTLGKKICFPESIQIAIAILEIPNTERSIISFGNMSRIKIGKNPIHEVGSKNAATAGYINANATPKRSRNITNSRSFIIIGYCTIMIPVFTGLRWSWYFQEPTWSNVKVHDSPFGILLQTSNALPRQSASVFSGYMEWVG